MALIIALAMMSLSHEIQKHFTYFSGSRSIYLHDALAYSASVFPLWLRRQRLQDSHFGGLPPWLATFFSSGQALPLLTN
jgi:hypothetical protein